MANETILINYNNHEVRAAVMNNGSVSEIFIERSKKRTAVGNIYKGKVVKVLPGMQSAFVDIGLSKAAFLHIADIHYRQDLLFEEVESDAMPSFDDGHMLYTDTTLIKGNSIEDIISEKQEIIVQVTKDAIGTKGARLTTHISIPGRYLVLMPNYEHIGVSRKIEDEEEREKLRLILKSICPKDFGLIARTVSKGQSEKDLTADRDYLVRTWSKVSEKNKKQGMSLLYEDANLMFRLLRDVVTDRTEEIIIDNKEKYKELLEYSRDYHPEILSKITLYSKEKPLFDFFNVEIEINKLMDKKVWLRSGGYIIIDHAEALTVIDVNTGRFVGKRNFEETILKTNLEAAREIAHQLKLRNIGGIIIIDFIDMETEENREAVLDLLDTLLKEDRARASVVDITSLGLVEITRKRSHEGAYRAITEPCPYCDGRGVVKSRMSVCYDILRQIKKISAEKKGGKILLEAHNEVADLLLANEREYLDKIEKEFYVQIEIKFRPSFHVEHYEVVLLEPSN